jgi:hypothetical protein
LLAHLVSGEVLASGRQAQAPHESENMRQSASVLQAVDVAVSSLVCEPAGAALAAAEAEGAAGSTATGAALGVADAAGEGSWSLRLHPPASKLADAAHATMDRRATWDSSADRTKATRRRDSGIAAAYRQLAALTSAPWAS